MSNKAVIPPLDAISAMWNRLWIMQRVVEDCEGTTPDEVEATVIIANLDALERHAKRLRELIDIARAEHNVTQCD